MNRLSQLCLTIITAGLSTTTLAVEPVWDYLSVSYQNVSIDNSDYRPSGFGISGASRIGDQGLMYLSYVTADDEQQGIEGDIEDIDVSAGGRFGVWRATDIYVLAGYRSQEVTVGTNNVKDDGLSAALGIRSVIIDNLEVGLKATYLNYAEGASDELNVSLQYYFTDTFAVGLGYTSGDIADSSFAQMTIIY